MIHLSPEVCWTLTVVFGWAVGFFMGYTA